MPSTPIESYTGIWTGSSKKKETWKIYWNIAHHLPFGLHSMPFPSFLFLSLIQYLQFIWLSVVQSIITLLCSLLPNLLNLLSICFLACKPSCFCSCCSSLPNVPHPSIICLFSKFRFRCYLLCYPNLKQALSLMNTHNTLYSSFWHISFHVVQLSMCTCLFHLTINSMKIKTYSVVKLF